MIFARHKTGPINFYHQEDTPFCQKVEYGLNCLGWKLQGSPALTYISENREVVAAQTIVGEQEGTWSGFIGMSEVARTERPNSEFYRLIVGRDDDAFCMNIERALNMGWTLYASPALTNNGRDAILGRALTKVVEEPYRGYIPTRSLLPHLRS